MQMVTKKKQQTASEAVDLPSLSHDFHEVVGQVSSSQIETQDGVRKGVTLVDGDGVGDTITDVEDETGGTARGVQGEDGLDAHVTVEGKKKFCFIYLRGRKKRGEMRGRRRRRERMRKN